MAMSYYTANYHYPYQAFSGHYDLYAHGADLSRNAQFARSALINNTTMTKSTESKPRLAKEEVEQLEAEFQKNSKPNTSLKKQLAEQMRVDAARINVLTQIHKGLMGELLTKPAELVPEQTGKGEA